MKIQVLGSGCPTCKNLYEITKKAIEELGIEAKLEYLTGQEGIEKIIEMGLISSPVLVIDGKPVLMGFIDEVEEIKKIILENKK